MDAEIEDWIVRTSIAIAPNLAEDLAQEARIMRWGKYADYHEHAVKRPMRLRMLDLAQGKKGWTGQSRPRRYDRKPEAPVPEMPEKIVFPDLDLALDVKAAVARLTPNERRFIYMRYWLKMSWTEVEEELGYGPQPVWRSARDKLRRELVHLRDAA